MQRLLNRSKIISDSGRKPTAPDQPVDFCLPQFDRQTSHAFLSAPAMPGHSLRGWRVLGLPQTISHPPG